MNSRAKGCRGEREFRDVLRCEGFLKARRGQQFSGSYDSPDVVCPELPSIHFEVKRVQAGNPYNWMAQAESDCISILDPASSKMPIVAHRRNGCNWLAILRMEDLLKLLKETDRVQ